MDSITPIKHTKSPAQIDEKLRAVVYKALEGLEAAIDSNASTEVINAYANAVKACDTYDPNG